jgi:hypothetical protein
MWFQVRKSGYLTLGFGSVTKGSAWTLITVDNLGYLARTFLLYFPYYLCFEELIFMRIRIQHFRRIQGFDDQQ